MIDDPVFSVTETGISAPSYEEIYEYLKGRMRAIFGDDINLDADTQDGQMVGIVAAAISDVNAQAIAVYNAYNPTTAKGVALDSAVKVVNERDKIPSRGGVVVNQNITINGADNPRAVGQAVAHETLLAQNRYGQRNLS